MARGEDVSFSRAGLNYIWVDDDWAKKFGYGEGVENTGGRWTIEQVVAMPEYSVDLLLEYFSVVRERTLYELEKSTDADMASVYNHPEMEEVTREWSFDHLIVEESVHFGQIALIRGMMRGIES